MRVSLSNDKRGCDTDLQDKYDHSHKNVHKSYTSRIISREKKFTKKLYQGDIILLNTQKHFQETVT